jgi:glycosyltransferase involved in cell wall biosynthesis
MNSDSERTKFSIVTSFFGEGKKYVERLYQDIQKQKVDWEWIVTDDFSENPETQASLLSISSSDKRVKYFAQDYKREIFRDPQKVATGEFVFHIDADDRVHPSYLLHCEYWFRRFPSVICILSGSEWVKENGVFNRFAFHRNSELDVKHDFVGRVWRNGFDFKFEKIFTNVNDIIRTTKKEKSGSYSRTLKLNLVMLQETIMRMSKLLIAPKDSEKLVHPEKRI